MVWRSRWHTIMVHMQPNVGDPLMLPTADTWILILPRDTVFCNSNTTCDLCSSTTCGICNTRCSNRRCVKIGNTHGRDWIVVGILCMLISNTNIR